MDVAGDYVVIHLSAPPGRESDEVHLVRWNDGFQKRVRTLGTIDNPIPVDRCDLVQVLKYLESDVCKFVTFLSNHVLCFVNIYHWCIELHEIWDGDFSLSVRLRLSLPELHEEARRSVSALDIAATSTSINTPYGTSNHGTTASSLPFWQDPSRAIIRFCFQTTIDDRRYPMSLFIHRSTLLSWSFTGGTRRPPNPQRRVLPTVPWAKWGVHSTRWSTEHHLPSAVAGTRIVSFERDYDFKGGTLRVHDYNFRAARHLCAKNGARRVKLENGNTVQVNYGGDLASKRNSEVYVKDVESGYHMRFIESVMHLPGKLYARLFMDDERIIGIHVGSLSTYSFRS